MPAFDLALRVAGGVIAVVLGAGFALLEATATPRAWFIPVLSALVGNAFLVWFAATTVETRWSWLLPAVPWVAVMLAATTSTIDLIANSWTGLGTLAAGTFVYFAAVAAGVPGKKGI